MGEICPGECPTPFPDGAAESARMENAALDREMRD